MSLSKSMELRRDRAELVEKAGAILKAAEKRGDGMTPEEEKSFDGFHNDADKLKEQIDRIERHELTTKELEESRGIKAGIFPTKGNGDGTEEPRNTPLAAEQLNSAIKRWSRKSGGAQLLTDEERTALRLDGGGSQIEIYPPSAEEIRALSTVTDTAGGFTVPETLWSRLTDALLAFGGMREASTVITTDGGEDLRFVTDDDTSNEGVIVGENTEVPGHTTGGVDPEFGQVVLSAFKYSSRIIKVPEELLEDSAFDIAGWLGRKIGERIGRITNRHFTAGTGTGQPNGITTASTLGITAASNSAITRAELIDLEMAVDQAYTVGPGTRWMFHRTTLGAFKKLSIGSGDDRPLWQPGMAVGAPDTIEGYPYIINNHMPGIGSLNISVVFGALDMYYIRLVRGLRVRRLNELYAGNDQVGFVAFQRADGDLIDAGTNPVKRLVHPL